MRSIEGPLAVGARVDLTEIEPEALNTTPLSGQVPDDEHIVEVRLVPMESDCSMGGTNRLGFHSAIAG